MLLTPKRHFFICICLLSYFKRISLSKDFIYVKCDDFDFDMVNFPFLESDVPRPTSYKVYISQLLLFVRVSSHRTDFNAFN